MRIYKLINKAGFYLPYLLVVPKIQKDPLRSDNILSLINAAPQALTISSTPSQSPAASHPRPSRKVHQQCCIRLIFYIHLTGSDSPVISKITEKLFERVNFVDKVPTSSGLYECLYSHFCINLLELSDISL